jgi:UDP-N-acetylenolpyruvoylglucosamine reductase
MHSIILSGAKNLTLPILSSTILSSNIYVFNNFNLNNDVDAQLYVLSQFNVRYFIEKNKIVIDTTNLKIPKSLDFCKNTRATYYFIGSTHRYNNSLNFTIDNGCDIDLRQINFHLDLLKKFNKPYFYNDKDQKLFVKKQEDNNNKQIIKYSLSKPSVGATINAILMAVGSDVDFVLSNYAKDPYVIELIKFLSQIGSNIKIFKNHIKIKGVSLYSNREIRFDIMSDPIEALTYILYSATTLYKNNKTKSNYTIGPLNIEHLGEAYNHLKKIGIFLVNSNIKYYYYIKVNTQLNTFFIKTNYFPGVYTDCQPMFALLASFIEGKSYITESIYKKRFNYIKEYQKHKIDINQICDNTICINGNKKTIFNKNNIVSDNHDLRSDMATMLLETITQNESSINTKFVDRGYSNYLQKIDCVQNNLEIKYDYPVKYLTNIKIGGTTKFYTEVNSIRDLISAINFSNKKNVPYRVIGSGYNIYFGEYYSGLVIKNNIKYNKVLEKNCTYIDIGSGNLLQDLIDTATEQQIDMHELSEIPGTIGGSIYGNAGAYGKEIKDFLHSVFVYDQKTQELKWIDAKKISLRYRSSEIKSGAVKCVILLAKFRLNKSTLSKDQIKSKNESVSIKRRVKFDYENNIGCIYKNTKIGKTTGQILEELDIKGTCISNMYISKKHANIWMNNNNANSNDIDNCINYISEKIKNLYNISLELEIEKI